MSFLDLAPIDFGEAPSLAFTPEVASAAANAWDPGISDSAWGMNYINPVPPAQPSWLQELGGVWSNAAQGIMTGAGETIKGMNQLLPNVLVSSLAQSMGLTSRTVQDANGKDVTYVQPAAAGVPPAGPVSVPVGGTSTTISTGLTIGAIAIIAGVGLLAILLLRGKH
jgi:hypothetical protein